MTKKDDRIDKRKVTCTSYATTVDGDGKAILLQHAFTDYVKLADLDAYKKDAETRWQHVAVGDEPDAGPGGYEGGYTEHEHLKLGKTLQQHLHDTGVKHIDDPTNNPHVLFSEGV